MINSVVLVGRITRDPLLKKTQSGASVTSFAVACNRKYKQEGQPEADFIKCIAWNKTAEIIIKYVKKGDLLGIEGRIQTRNYDDAAGKKVYITEVVVESVQLLGGRKDSSDAPYVPDKPNSAANDNQGFDSVDTIDIASEDLPF